MFGSIAASEEDVEPRHPLRNRPVHPLDRDDNDDEEVIVVESDEEALGDGLIQSVVGPSQSVSITASTASTRAPQAKRSWVWSYFEQLPGGQQAKCKIAGCGTVITTKAGSTKSMANHLAGGRKRHGITADIHASLTNAEASASHGPGAPVQMTIEQSQALGFKQDVFEERLTEWTVLAQATLTLSWWSTNASAYPRLALMARDFLAIPGTETSSERAFSSARRLISWERNRLGDNTIRACECVKSWLEALR